MTPDDIKGGESVFIDSNIILYALARKSGQCRSLLSRCASREVNGVISTVVIAEVAHRRMMMEARLLHNITSSNPARALSKKPDLVRRLTIYRQEAHDLVHGELHVEAALPRDIVQALGIQRDYGLMMNDSLNIAVAKRLGVIRIATADENFGSLGDWTVFKPDDLEI